MALMDQQAPAGAGGDPGFNNPMLGKVNAELESRITPNNIVNYRKIVIAGMRVVMAKGPQGLIQKLTNSQNPLATATAGPINLVLILARQAKGGKMPAIAAIPASETLMFHALDFLDHTGRLQVTPDVLDQATKMWTDNVMRAWNVSKQQLEGMAAKAHGAMTNPQSLAAMHQHAQDIVNTGGRPTVAPPQPPARPPPAGPAQAAPPGAQPAPPQPLMGR
jgi:hypothetical protein